jgi:tellurite resistance protein TerC
VSGDGGPWAVLAVVVGSMLALDLLVVHRDARPDTFRQAAAWSAVWIGLALGFGGFVATTWGGDAGAEYLAGYLIELSLSVDNVFVFALIFAAFAVPAAYQHRLLFWGILGAIVFRAVFIAAGTAVLAAAHWVIYLLGVLLIVTGVRLVRSQGHAVEPDRNPALRLFRRVVPTAAGDRGPAFFVREGGRRLATPLLAVLITIETTDIMFALDSIPAVFAVTTEPFIVFSSNLFAILGLRSLYFLLAGLLDRLTYLKVGLAALLVFAGAKILVGTVYEIPVAISLAVIVVILGTTAGASLLATDPRRSALRGPLLRIAAGVGLGFAALGFFGFAATVRDGVSRPAVPPDAGPAWIALDLAILGTGAAAVLLVTAALRHAHARSALVRGWAAAGAALMLILIIITAGD